MLVFSISDTHCRELRGKAMECVGIIAKCVGKDKFGPDAAEILDLLVGTQKRGLEGDDPQYHYMVQALTRICQCLGPVYLTFFTFSHPLMLTISHPFTSIFIIF
jgi:hypothetical protein